jgi:argininosuccinate lyase
LATAAATMQQDDKPAPSGKAWSGRFSEPLDALTQRFNASIAFDRRLAEVDIQGSLAHARMLARAKIIGADDLKAIERGMARILKEVRSGRSHGRSSARTSTSISSTG